MGKQGVEVINKIAVTAGQITPPKTLREKEYCTEL